MTIYNKTDKKTIQESLLQAAVKLNEKGEKHSMGACILISNYFADNEVSLNFEDAILDEFQEIFAPNAYPSENPLFWLYNKNQTKQVNKDRRVFAVLLFREIMQDNKFFNKLKENK